MTSYGVENQMLEATNKSKKRSTPSSAIKKSKAKVTKKVSTETDRFNAFMLTLAKDRIEDRKKAVLKTANTVLLAEQFRRMSNALGSSVKAAYSCEDFVRFLDKKERKELRKYRKEMASVNDVSSSDSD